MLIYRQNDTGLFLLESIIIPIHSRLQAVCYHRNEQYSPGTTALVRKGLTGMSISREDVEHIAKLARMRLTEDEIIAMTTQLSSILGHIAVLQEADVSGVETTPTLQPHAGIMSDDIVRPSYPPSELLANAPERENDYARVKAVLE